MPYIKPIMRGFVDPQISDLADNIRGCFGKEVRAGALNYTISKLIKDVYGSDLSYAQYNEIIGALESCKLEFYRAQVAPYEDLKRMENGEV